MAAVVRKVFDARAKSFFDTSIDSLDVTPHGKLLCVAKFENLKLMNGLRSLLTTLIYTLRKLALKKHLLASFGLVLKSSRVWSAVFILGQFGQ